MEYPAIMLQQANEGASLEFYWTQALMKVELLIL